MTHQQELELLAEWLGIEGRWSPVHGFVVMEAGFDAEPFTWNPSPTGNSDDFLNMVAGRVDIFWFWESVEAHEAEGNKKWVEFFADHNNDKLAAMKHAAYQVCLMAAKEWKEQ